MLNFVENCRLGLRCLDAPVTLPLGLYMYIFCNAYLFSWCEVQMLFSKFTISMCIVSKLANTTEEYKTAKQTIGFSSFFLKNGFTRREARPFL